MFELTTDKLKAIAKMPQAQRAIALRLVGKAEFEKCANDILYWLDPSKHVKTEEWPEGLPYVYTCDPHPMFKCKRCEDVHAFYKRSDHLRIFHGVDTENEADFRKFFEEMSPTRPFYLLEYMEPIIRWWLRKPFMAIEKSRDMMATWLTVTMYTWDTLFHQGRQNIFQSEDAAKTIELVERAFFIWEHQPRFLRMVAPATFGAGTAKSGVLKVPSLNSSLLGFPQGADQIRQFHPTGVFQDEAAFQIAAGEAFAAIKPAVQNGGRFTAVSSANPSWFMHICKDTIV